MGVVTEIDRMEHSARPNSSRGILGGVDASPARLISFAGDAWVCDDLDVADGEQLVVVRLQVRPVVGVDAA